MTGVKKSYKADVVADASGEWNSNALRFATPEEADAYGRHLWSRWTLVTAMRVTETDEPVTARWETGEGLVHLS